MCCQYAVQQFGQLFLKYFLNEVVLYLGVERNFCWDVIILRPL